jgi:hypothetical protein
VTWTAGNLPQELTDILDLRAGKVHSEQGPVRAALAEILNAYDRLTVAPLIYRQQRDMRTILNLCASLIDSNQTIFGLLGSGDA